MLVVKDTCMAAIEYFTEPGDDLSILIILIDIVIVIEYLTEPGDQLPETRTIFWQMSNINNFCI